MLTRKIPRILGSIDIASILYEKEEERKGKGAFLNLCALCVCSEKFEVQGSKFKVNCR